MGGGKKQFLVAAVFDGHDGRFVSSQARKLVAKSVEGRLFEKEEGRFKKDEDYSAKREMSTTGDDDGNCLLYTSPSPRDGLLSRMPSSA